MLRFLMSESAGGSHLALPTCVTVAPSNDTRSSIPHHSLLPLAENGQWSFCLLIIFETLIECHELQTYAGDLTLYPDDLSLYPDDLTLYADDLTLYTEDMSLYPDDLTLYANDLTLYADDLTLYADDLSLP